MSDSKNTSGSPDGLFSVATCALVSTYIADQRPEGDRLGEWAEVAQAVSVVSLIVGVVLLVVVLFIGLLALMFGRD